MHILVVPSWYKSDDKPFSGSFFEEQARLLQSHGHRAAVFYPEWSGSFRSGLRRLFRTRRAFHDDGLPTYHSRIDPVLPRENALNARRLRREAERFGRAYAERFGVPDLIHAHSVLYGGAAGAALRDLWRAPLVLTEHYSLLIREREPVSPFVARLVSDVARSADATVCVSRFQHQQLLARYGTAFQGARVVGNLVSDLFLDPAPRGRGPGPFTWITVGNLVPIKRTALALEAFRSFRERVPESRLVLIGDGPEKRALHERAAALGLDGRVEFRGSLSRDRVRDCIDAADALLSASERETFGLGIAEALARGKPVVITDSGGPRDFVDESNGIIVEGAAAGDLADGMLRLHRQIARFEPQRIQAGVASRFSGAAIYAELMSVYGAAAGKAP